MKTILNIITVILILSIGADIEVNSSLNTPDYSNTVLKTLILFSAIYGRFKITLTNKI